MIFKRRKTMNVKGLKINFLCLILFGYVAGIASKLVSEAYMASIGQKWYVLFFYVLNFTMVSVDLAIYIRNYRLDVQREKEDIR